MTLRPGVHSVLATPFRRDESVDEESVRTLVDYCAAAGVAGVLALGVLGEASKLDDEERERLQTLAVEAAAGQVQLTVGISHPATVVAAARARSAQAVGADAVMLSPPVDSKAGPELRDYFLRAAEGLTIPVVVQDLREASGVELPVDFLAALLAELPAGSLVKLEDPPTAVKIAALRAASPDLAMLGGLGGVGLLQELDAGSSGTMTGFALPGLLVEIVSAHAGGELERARETFERALPLLVFEAQPVVGLGVRKEILRRRGAIAEAVVRTPAPRLDRRTLAELEILLEATQEVAS